MSLFRNCVRSCIFLLPVLEPFGGAQKSFIPPCMESAILIRVRHGLQLFSFVIDDVMIVVMVMSSPAAAPAAPTAAVVRIVRGLSGVLLSLVVLFALHTPILEPDFDLALRQVEIACQLPSLLFRDVGVEKKLFFELEGLEL